MLLASVACLFGKDIWVTNGACVRVPHKSAATQGEAATGMRIENRVIIMMALGDAAHEKDDESWSNLRRWAISLRYDIPTAQARLTVAA